MEHGLEGYEELTLRTVSSLVASMMFPLTLSLPDMKAFCPLSFPSASWTRERGYQLEDQGRRRSESIDWIRPGSKTRA